MIAKSLIYVCINYMRNVRYFSDINITENILLWYRNLTTFKLTGGSAWDNKRVKSSLSKLWRHIRGVKHSSTNSYSRGQKESSVQCKAPTALPQGKNMGFYFKEYLVSTRARMDFRKREKFLSSNGFWTPLYSALILVSY